MIAIQVYLFIVHRYIYPSWPAKSHELMTWLPNITLKQTAECKYIFKVVFVDHGVCMMVCTSDDTGQGCDPSVRTFKGGDTCSFLIHWKSLFYLCKTDAFYIDFIKFLTQFHMLSCL